jgi:hypothetical protein
MTNNNNKKPINCYCGKMSVATFVAGVQCFECETVDKKAAGFGFQSTAVAWKQYGDKVTRQIAEFEAGPNYIDPSRYATTDA